jgi:hypothetical protein
MTIRRIVTGHGPDGRPAVVSSGAIPRRHDYVHIPGMSEALAWSTEPGQPAAGGGDDPTSAVTTYVPGAGATRLLTVTFPPGSVFADPGFDPLAAGSEQAQASPGLAERFEPGGFHRTETVDYAFVLNGILWLDLGDEPPVELHVGDIVVQNATRHAWRNLGDHPATAAFVLVGVPGAAFKNRGTMSVPRPGDVS